MRYYGYYSNKSRACAKRRKADDQLDIIRPNPLSSSQFRQNWARRIQKIYEVDPLVCPKCQDFMRIVAFIKENRMAVLGMLMEGKHLELGRPLSDPGRILSQDRE